MRRLVAWLVLVGWAACAAAQQNVVRIDDTGTMLSEPVVQMKWRQLVPGRAFDNTVEAQVRVALRLHFEQLVNQPIRLYMALAPGTDVPVQARWRTQGRLLAGTVRSGGRALVYEGPAPGPILEETIELHLETDGRYLVSAQNLQFYFEAEKR
ncbi:MAG TPA: hypothetical protein VHA82_06510 [Ramlibacter sp.]|uniref:hypothetical protein n=1 Tax=Ramlibacter sp. TaxID=1917967 RepID=UPI002BD1309B|nr:hypothetical protein [Ramlibacter sp.]HVZ43447.1 hypothetical protein [Ramlibacter sp.]